ncbi:MAG: hypothetical protein ACYCXG_11740 [Acidiferrobacter sp.]
MTALALGLAGLYAALWVFVIAVNRMIGYRALANPTPRVLFGAARSWLRLARHR